MTTKTPEITVLMSSYNSEDFIEESISSILNQSFTDLELIVVDDASSDNTVEKIKRFADSRIKLIQLSNNVGVGAALQRGLIEAQGKFIAKADSDDIYLPSHLEKELLFLKNNSEIALVKSMIEYFPHDEQTAQTQRYKDMKLIKEAQLNSIVTTEQIAQNIRWWCCIPHNTIMLRAELAKKVGYIDARICEDYTLFYTINKLGYKMGSLEEQTVKFRVRESSVTGTLKHQEEYVRLIFELKREELSYFLRQLRTNVYIWGSGQLGRILCQELERNNFTIAGFIDGTGRNVGKYIDGIEIFGTSVVENSSNKQRIIVAAQPVREKVIGLLNNYGYTEEDYFIFS